ncbi:MAG: hypothetical protein IPK79_11490 [Vampirovibrionales bacterium]|nr:hypothetical protein [Vampirovibrionales bacterium]
MTEQELYALADNTNLFEVLDVKTLALDIVREMSEDELLALLLQKLPAMTGDQVREYFYMRRV